MQREDSPPPATVEPGPGTAAHPLLAFPDGAMVYRVRVVGGDWLSQVVKQGLSEEVTLI